MDEKEMKRKLDLPKRHALAHYIRQLGRLYGETPDLVNDYISEQLAANEKDLDKAIECFKTAIEVTQAIKKDGL